MIRSALLALLLTLTALSPIARAQATAPQSTEWLDTLRAVPVQEGGRVMPLGTYANNLAVQLTGRTHWSEGRGPAIFSDRDSIELLCDLVFKPDQLMLAEFVAIENRPFKTKVGLDPQREFFTPMEIFSCQGITKLLQEFDERRATDSSAPALPDEKKALALSSAIDRIAQFTSRTPLPIVPAGEGETFLRVGPTGGQPGTEPVQAALSAFGQAYLSGAPLDAPALQVADAVDSVGILSDREKSAIRYELFYNAHKPWRLSAVAYIASIIAFGVSRLCLRKPLVWLAVLLGIWGFAEQALGTGLRVAILGRAPVSNTYEALLWMGLVAILIGLVLQGFNRKGYYVFAGVCAALASVLFAGLVPIQDQTNSLPAVLRSNYWLTIHVLTIVASYGVLAVASVLGHVYLAKHVLFGRRKDIMDDAERESPPLVVQTIRAIQVGLILLTAGTILGGVWAADSWGRFWGWDPKETWALISIVIYFAVLHARLVGWLRNFGLTAAAVIGFTSIVWCFYGVNYVMATGLHSYGFGSGGEVWVGLWAIAELIFLGACRWRYVSLRRAAGSDLAARHTPEPTAA